MSKSKAGLSITKRVLLDYIKFKTRNNFKFFGDNEYIGKVLDLTYNSTKTFINDLIRDGYLYKEIDKKGRRILSLTGKDYKPLFEDYSNAEKKVLVLDRDNAVRDNQYLQQQLATETAHGEQLLQEKTELILTNQELTYKVKDLEDRLSNLEKRMGAVEKFFTNEGVSKEKLEEIIQENL